MELENLKHLKKTKSKKVFVAFILLFMVIDLILLIYFDKVKVILGSSVLPTVIKEVLINLEASTLTALLLFIIIFWMLPEELNTPEVAVLDPTKTKREHEKALNDTSFWSHNGHLGRWVRTNAMPKLLIKAKSGVPTFVNLIILNPNNPKLCNEYVKYRKSIFLSEPDKDSINVIEDLQAEILATVVVSYIHEYNPAQLRVRVFFNNQFSLSREDISSYAVFRTQTKPTCDCLAFYNRGDRQSQFYNLSQLDFQTALNFSIEVDFKRDESPLQISLENLTIDHIRSCLEKIGLLIHESDAFLQNIKHRIDSNYNPHE